MMMEPLVLQVPGQDALTVTDCFHTGMFFIISYMTKLYIFVAVTCPEPPEKPYGGTRLWRNKNYNYPSSIEYVTHKI